MTMIAAKALHRKWTKDPAYKTEYGALSGKLSLTGALLDERGRAGSTQPRGAEAPRWPTARTVRQTSE